tara:strand:+ start:762 stop:1493 length:732 start_codon:yes stop_codon:yes gene_type:complete
MCLILFAVQPNEKLRLVIAANRDELYDRPASSAGYWQDSPEVLGGRDLQMGGTWLGISKQGRFAAVTNFRETPADPLPPRSRGELTSKFLTTDLAARDYLEDIRTLEQEYRGFNLILHDGTDMYYYSNRMDSIRILEPGFYGLSNQLLDCDWPKVTEGRLKMSHIVQSHSEVEVLHQELFKVLFDPGDSEPFSNCFIATDEYGTCAATVLSISSGGETNFQEQGFSKNGKREQLSSYSLLLPP